MALAVYFLIKNFLALNSIRKHHSNPLLFSANKWGVHILENKGEELTNWSKFQKSFKERFIQSLTLQEKMNLRDLRMTSTETCRDFYDRCRNNINLFYENEFQLGFYQGNSFQNKEKLSFQRKT